MGSIVLVVRLVLADVRRHKVQVAILLLAVTVATATMALGLSLRDVSDTLYEQTRAATAGPDVVALSGDRGPAVTSALASLANDPEVVAHHGPYRIVYADLTTRDSTSSPVVVHGFAETPGAVNRPLVTSGQWVRPGGTVLERGFATALGVGVGRSYPIEARPSMAIARTLGATPGQISAGLSTAQLLSSLPGAILGVPLGLGLFSIFALGNWTVPPFSWLLGAALATLLATAALTALPARLAARQPVAQALSAETA